MKNDMKSAVLKTIKITCLLFFAVFACAIEAMSEDQPVISRYYDDSLFGITESKHFGIEIVIRDKELKAGANHMELLIHDSANNDVENAELTVTPWKPEDGRGVSDEPAVAEMGGGFYSVENLVLDTGGHWELKVTVKKGSLEDTAVFDFPEVKVPEGMETVEAAAPAPAGYEKYRSVFKPISVIPLIPADNSMTPDKIRLGKMLFWDRRLSEDGGQGCATCHHPAFYGAEPHRQSVSNKGKAPMRNAPTVLNSAFLNSFSWNGDIYTLEQQVLNEMKTYMSNEKLAEEVIEDLNRITGYRELSEKVFGEPLNEENISKALASFVRTLSTPNYPLAKWIQGDDNALDDRQKKGMELFAEKGCIRCHYGPAFAGEINVHQKKKTNSFRVILPEAQDDTGLMLKTGNEEDRYFFRVPSLLNIAMTAPYTHTGTIDSLKNMVIFMADYMLDSKLGEQEADDIAAFLKSLTGEIPVDFITVPLLPTQRD